VRAVCQPPPEVFSTLDAAMRKKGDKAREWIAVRLEDFEGTHVADARFLAVLKRYAPATTEAGAPPPP
jgi:hypothetical protein